MQEPISETGNIKKHARYESIFAILVALFVTFVVLTNTVGVKLFTLYGFTFGVSIFWYPLTFLITDITSEIYGARRASFMVVVGFSMSVLLLLFSLLGIALPAAEFYAGEEAYVTIFGPVWRLLFGSMAAYLLAQLIDVRLFHFWKRVTKGKHLWLRNNGSTILSQLIDSLTVNIIFLYKNPVVFTGDFMDVITVALNVYVFKVIIAALDTPLCYVGVRFFEKLTGVKGKEVM
ncbi:MAG: VUT family protein [Calditrichaeota bacterium]|nr:MAG: VUT family protein [Calditrichota bacterium]